MKLIDILSKLQASHSAYIVVTYDGRPILSDHFTEDEERFDNKTVDKIELASYGQNHSPIIKITLEANIYSEEGC